jgi:hypothetical protein
MRLPDICWGGTRKKSDMCYKCKSKNLKKIILDSEGSGPCILRLVSVNCLDCKERWTEIH